MNLAALIIDDNVSFVEGFIETCLKSFGGCTIYWEACTSFKEALLKIELYQYDIIVTDLKNDEEDSPNGEDVVRRIREITFCPVLLISGNSPEWLDTTQESFIEFSQKGSPRSMEEVDGYLKRFIDSGLPQVVRRLHKDLNKAESYLWELFTGNSEEDRNNSRLNDIETLERVLRNRASIQLASVSTDDGTEILKASAADFYIYPPLSTHFFRLGSIVARRDRTDFRIVLTPSCYLRKQQGQTLPRAKMVLLAKLVPFDQYLAEWNSPPWKEGGTENEYLGKLKSRLKCPSRDAGQPDGRAWFLPGFLDIPDSFCDFMQVETVRYETLETEFEHIAVLNSPYAESLQYFFSEFYSSVGIPDLRPENFRYLLPQVNQNSPES